MQARLPLLLAALVLLPALAWAASPFTGTWRGDASNGGVRNGLSLTITGDGTVSGTLALSAAPLQLSGFVGDDGRATLVGRDPARSLRRVLGTLQVAGGGLAGFLDVTAPTGQAPLHYTLQLAAPGAQAPVASAAGPNAAPLSQLFSAPTPSPAPAAPPPAMRPDARMLSELFAKPPPPPPAPAPAPAVAASPAPAPAPQPIASAPPPATRPDARMLSELFAKPAPPPPTAPAPAVPPAPTPPAPRVVAAPSPAASSKAQALDAPVGPPAAAAPVIQASPAPPPTPQRSPFAGDWVGDVVFAGEPGQLALTIGPDGSVTATTADPAGQPGPAGSGRVEPNGSMRLTFAEPDGRPGKRAVGTLTIVGDHLDGSFAVSGPDQTAGPKIAFSLGRREAGAAAPRAEPKDPFAVPPPGRTPAASAASSPFAGDWVGKVDLKNSDMSLRIAPDGSIVSLPGGPNDGPITGAVDRNGNVSMAVTDKDEQIPLKGKFDLVGDRIFAVIKVQTRDFTGRLGINLQRVPGPGARLQPTPSRFVGVWNGFAETMSDLSKRDMSIVVDPDGNFEGTVGGDAPGHLDVSGWIRPDGRAFFGMFDNTGNGVATAGEAMLTVNGNGLFGQITASDEDGHAKGQVMVVLDKGG